MESLSCQSISQRGFVVRSCSISRITATSVKCVVICESPSRCSLYSSNQSFKTPIFSPIQWLRKAERHWRRKRAIRAVAESPYDILGVSKSATEKDIKKAYRKLALKFHPDVNKEADAQAKFIRIKQAYQMLSDAGSRSKYDRAGTGSTSSWGEEFDPLAWASGGKRTTQEEFYGLDSFFKDLQKDFEKRQERSKGAPKSLWEELSEIGGEFVEFLESSLPEESGPKKEEGKNVQREGKAVPRGNQQKGTDAKAEPKVEEKSGTSGKSLEDEIEDMLSNLKKEIGKL